MKLLLCLFALYIVSCFAIPMETTATTDIDDTNDDNDDDNDNYNDNDNHSDTEDDMTSSISINATIIIIEDNPTPTSAYYSSNFLVIPTNNEQLDEEVRAARVIGSKLALPLPLLPQQQETATAQWLDQEVQVEEEEAKIPDDNNNNNNNDRSSNAIEEENDEQKKVNNSLIAEIVGASGAGMVAMIAIGILVWQNTRQRPHQLSSNKDTIGSPNEKHERKKGPLLFSLPSEPMMATAVTASHRTTAAFNSHFNKWEGQEQQQQCHVSKFPSSTTYSTLFPTLATTHNVDNDNNNNNTNGITPKHHEEEEWSSDTGSSESLSIRNLSTYDSTEENKAATDATTDIPKQQQQQQLLRNGVGSTLSVNYSHPSTIQPQVLNDGLPSQQKQKQKEIPMIDKDRKFQLSLVNKKILHYPARSRHGFASTSIKSPYNESQNDDPQGGMVSYDLDKLFYPSETKRNSSSSSSASVATIMSEDCPPEQHQLIRLIRQHYHVTPFDLPPSRFLPLQNCPFQLVTRQSILDDPEKRQGVHEIPE